MITKKIKNKERCNHCNNMPMQSLLGTNHRQHLFHMAKSFIYIKETKEPINEFSIGYIINPTLNIKKTFREKLNKCMNTTFGEIT